MGGVPFFIFSNNFIVWSFCNNKVHSKSKDWIAKWSLWSCDIVRAKILGKHGDFSYLVVYNSDVKEIDKR
jgi:hypothetical protein